MPVIVEMKSCTLFTNHSVFFCAAVTICTMQIKILNQDVNLNCALQITNEDQIALNLTQYSDPNWFSVDYLVI